MVPLIPSVLAAEPPAERNLAVVDLGAQLGVAPALRGLDTIEGDFDGDGIPNADDPADSSDLDILFGQRIRWTLWEGGATALRLRVRGQFTYSPGEEAPQPGQLPSPKWKRNRVRQLGMSVVNPRFTLDLGRHRVHKGGPRLVDGLQLVLHPTGTTDVGFWAGLQPDLFTSEPRLRPGGGPIVAYTASRFQASAIGEVVFGGGGLDRLGGLFQARLSAARTLDVAARLDVDLADGLRIQDGQLFARWSPAPRVSVDGFYNLFSSFLYQRTENLDPDLQRFGQRVINQGLLDVARDVVPVVLQDCLDPGLGHLLGGDLRVRPEGRDPGLFARFGVRYRLGQDVDPPVPEGEPRCVLDDVNSFLRISPRLGVANLPVGGGLDLTLDANLYNIEGRRQADAGITFYFEPDGEGRFAIDTSYRMLFNRYDPVKNPYGYAGTGHYADLFVDAALDRAGMMVGIGLNLESEPAYVADDLSFKEGGLGAYARISKYLRPGRRE